MRLTALIIAGILAGCQVDSPGFDTTAIANVTYAKPGTNMQNTVLKGEVFTSPGTYANLTVAAVTVKRTVAFAKVTGKTFALSLPAQTAYENESAFAVHAIWEVVLFNDVNNNGVYDTEMPPSKTNERDIPIPTVESYRLNYKGYVSSPKSYAFLPLNDFERGWILVKRVGSQPSQNNQDFEKSYSLTDSFYYTYQSINR